MKRIGRRAGRQTTHSIRLWTCGLWVNMWHVSLPGMPPAKRQCLMDRSYHRARERQNPPFGGPCGRLAGRRVSNIPSSIETVALWISPLIGSPAAGSTIVRQCPNSTRRQLGCQVCSAPKAPH